MQLLSPQCSFQTASDFLHDQVQKVSESLTDSTFFSCYSNLPLKSTTCLDISSFTSLDSQAPLLLGLDLAFLQSPVSLFSDHFSLSPDQPQDCTSISIPLRPLLTRCSCSTLDDCWKTDSDSEFVANLSPSLLGPSLADGLETTAALITAPSLTGASILDVSESICDQVRVPSFLETPLPLEAVAEMELRSQGSQPIPPPLPFGAYIPNLETNDPHLLPDVINLSSARLSTEQIAALNTKVKF